ncbi:MAG: GDSL-type esterase/lipase family protein, partial [Verrucomicrobiales bacterium]
VEELYNLDEDIGETRNLAREHPEILERLRGLMDDIARDPDDPAPGNSVTVALVGDSTVTDTAGWGKAFASRFGPRVKTLNFAVGGRSAKSFFDEGRLPAVLESKPDYVLIQFGHNGQPGKGPNRETDPATSYRKFLRIYVNRARAIGAVPILISSVVRRDFNENGKIKTRLAPGEAVGTKGVYTPLSAWAEATRATAANMKVPFIDLHSASRKLHNRMGEKASMSFNPKEGDITHFNEKGAAAIADLIVVELARADKDLAAYLK